VTGKTFGNWGRWGSHDERGVANLLTEDHVLQSLRTAATKGRLYPLAQPIRLNGTPRSDSGLSLHLMSQDAGDYATGAVAQVGDGQSVAMDYLFLRLHGSSTHVDALGHVWSGDQLYNGLTSAGGGSAGLRHCAIDRLPGMVTRGVLLDVAGRRNVQRLESSMEITVDELEACLREEGVDLRAGDAVLIRTGWPSMYAEDAERYVWEFPGIGLEAARWLAGNDVVLVGADTLGVEVRTRAQPWDLPVHLCLLHEHGVHMLELLNLERLAADKVYQFLFMLAPLPITGGTGSPVNPLAIA
jgi:kynurenine formamidase